MRTIKFRGKEVEDNEWGYGYLFQLGSRTLILEPTESLGCDGKKRPDYYELDVDPETVGQFTGLFDKNGKEIYEGDILRLFDNPKYSYTCVYVQEQASFLGRCNETRFGLANITDGVAKEIIGNIHDNPELLK